MPSDQQLRQMMSQIALPFDNSYVLGDGPLILPFSVDTFYERFLRDGAPMNFEVFSRDVQKHSQVQIGRLEPTGDREWRRRFSQVIPVSGVPWKSQSAYSKTEVIKRPRR